MRTGESARSVADRPGTEFGASTASEELAQDAAFFVNSRGQIGIGGECVSCAYR